MGMLPYKDAETSGLIYAPYMPMIFTKTEIRQNYYSVKYQDKTFDVDIENKNLGIYLKKKNTKKKKIVLNINHDDKGIRQLCRFILGLTTEGYVRPFPNTRKLSASFSLKAAFDINSIGFGKEFIEKFSREITDEIDRDLINKMKEQITK
jgi:hypothetical protein